MVLLDADVLIDVQRGHAPAVAWLDSLEQPPSVPGPVVMELIQDAKNKKQVAEAKKLFAFPRVWPTDTDCELALETFLAFHLSHGLGLLDSLIGACALGLQSPLCTFNVKHYKLVPGLVTIQPYKR